LRIEYGFEGAVYIFALEMKHPSTDGSGLIGQQVATLSVHKMIQTAAWGFFGAVAALMKCGANRSNFLRARRASLALDFLTGNFWVVELTANGRT
jgi:hypothetical protein